jgi:hypothetical protein
MLAMRYGFVLGPDFMVHGVAVHYTRSKLRHGQYRTRDKGVEIYEPGTCVRDDQESIIELKNKRLHTYLTYLHACVRAYMRLHVQPGVAYAYVMCIHAMPLTWDACLHTTYSMFMQ